MPKASDLLCDALVEAGIDHVFGLPGGGTTAIWDALFDKQDQIRPILARHEGGAACMADMYGRLTGKPGVVIGQGLWIGTSGGYGIVEAYLAGVPMVAILDVSDYNALGQFGPYQNATGDYGAVDLPNIMKGMTKYTAYASNASELAHGIQLAIKHAVTGRPGPTAVLFKMAVAAAPLNPGEAIPKLHPLAGYLKTSPPCISREDADKAAELLIQAEKPVMICGAGVHRARAYDEVRELAELIGMPVATTYMGKSAIAETHELSLGTMGLIGQRVANDQVMAADVLFAVGTCLAPDNTKMQSSRFINPKTQKIIQVDIESLNAGWTYPLELGITSDAGLALKEIIAAVRAKAPGLDVKSRVAALQTAKVEAKFFNEDVLSSDETPIAPERVVKELNELAGEDDLIVLDAGNNRMWMAHHFRTRKAGQIIAAGGAAGVGYGLAASLSAQILKPGHRVICVCGDGGMMMHLYVLEMAREYRLPVTYVVMNNACLGNVMDFQPMERRIVSEYTRPDFARIARGFEVEGLRVDNPSDVAPALKKALEMNAPAVVDITVADYPHFRMRA